MNYYEIMALIAGGMIILCTLPQVLKTLKTKDVRGLSLQMFLLLGSAQILWFIYGIHLNDMPLILTNAGSVILVFTNVFLILKYKNAKNPN